MIRPRKMSADSTVPNHYHRPGVETKHSGVRNAHREVAERNKIVWRESMGTDYFQCPACLDWLRLPKKAMHHCSDNEKVKP